MIGISGLIADKNFRKITDPDIVNILQDLKNLPDNVLMGYAQNPNDPKQTYALSVLVSRKNAKDEAATQPQSTVKDDVIASISEPPKGLNTLASNQPAPQGIGAPGPTPQQLTQAGGVTRLVSNVGRNYAGGGIVAFAGEGGSLVDRAFGVKDSFQLKPNQTPFNVIPTANNSKAMLDYYEKQLGALQQAKKSGLPGVVMGSGELEATEMLLKKKIDDIKKSSAFKDLELNKEAALDQADLGDVDKQGSMTAPEDYLSKSTDEIVNTKDLLQQADRNIDQAKIDAEREANEKIAEEQARDAMKKEYSDKITTNIQDFIKDADEMKSNKVLTNHLSDIKNIYKEQGIDESIFGQVDTMNKEAKERITKDRFVASDLALIEAGLLVASGESPNALSNLGKAAPAVQNYIKNIQSLRGEERDLAKMELMVASAKTAMKQGMVDKAMSLYSQQETINKGIDMAKLNNKQQARRDEITTLANMDMQKIKESAAYKQAMEILEKQESGKDTRLEKDIEGRKEIAKISASKSGNLDEKTLFKARADASTEWDKNLLLQKQYPIKQDYINSVVGSAYGAPTSATNQSSGTIFDVDY